MPTEKATINGIELVYDREGTGQPLVMLHGATMSSVYWEAFVPYLLDEYTCTALDFRGHGRSARPPDGDHSFESVVDDCVAFLDAVVAAPAILVGQSLGGEVALMAATKRPDLVRGVFSEDAVFRAFTLPRSGSVDQLGLVLGAMKACVEQRARDGLSLAQHARNVGRIGIPTGRGAVPIGRLMPPTVLVFWARNTYDADPSMFAMFEDRPEYETDITTLLAELRCPVHVAYGNMKLGAIVAAEDITAFEAAGVPVTSTYYEGAGHMISPLFPREFLADLQAFLARVAA
jgi:pimeloyl-ACP methyl ester carboxylesterase